MKKQFSTLRDYRTGLPLTIETPKRTSRTFPITGRPLRKGESIETDARKSAERLIMALRSDDPSVMI